MSPAGWLPDRISIGVLTRVFTPELVDEAVDSAGAREQRRRLLPARLVVYFVLALWLFRGRNCGYGQVMLKLADGLYSRQLGADLLEGRPAAGMRVDAGQGREWWLPNISSLSRGRAKLGPDVHRYLFTRVAGPIGADDAPGVFCCGLRVVSMDGSVTDVPDEKPNGEFSFRAGTATHVMRGPHGKDLGVEDVLALRHFEGLSNSEVALVLGLSKTAASNRYIRALGRLKAMLTGLPGIVDD